MRGKRQRHPVKTNIYIGMVVHFFGIHGDTIDKSDAAYEPRKIKSAANGLLTLRPVRDGF